MHMNILTGVTQGVINDAKVLKVALHTLGYNGVIQLKQPASFNLKKRYPLIWHRLSKKLIGKANVNFHIESMREAWIDQAINNVWLPNPECVADQIMKVGHKSNCIFCKTSHTHFILNENGFENLIYTGFTSLDRRDANCVKDFSKYLHIMGQSHFKGTKPLIDVWSKHPEWPELTILATETPWNDIGWLRGLSHKNIHLIEGPVSEDKIIELQNTAGIHLCPSEAEGFGHYIVEALSVGAVVLTTNAPPMNEHIDESHGVLVDYQDTEKKNMGILYKVNKDSLENRLIELISLDNSMLDEMSKKARRKYEVITKSFYLNLKKWLDKKF